MILKTLDKILFGGLLLVFFQMPLLTNDYLQFLNGYFLSTKDQVDGFKLNARRNEYVDVYEMIEDFKANANPAVRMDGEQKQQTMEEYIALIQGIEILQGGNVIKKALYMLDPERWHVLKAVIENFKPGIPLTLYGFGASLLAALLLGAAVMWPLNQLFRLKKA